MRVGGGEQFEGLTSRTSIARHCYIPAGRGDEGALFGVQDVRPGQYCSLLRHRRVCHYCAGQEVRITDHLRPRTSPIWPRLQTYFCGEWHHTDEDEQLIKKPAT